MAALVVVALAITACGSQVPRSEIAAAVTGAVEARATGAPGLPTGESETGEATVPAAEDPTAPLPDDLATALPVQVPGAAPGAVPGAAPEAAPAAAPGTTAGPSEQPPAGPQQATLSTVRLGHIGTYSGLLGAIFAGGREMVQVWANSVNARGGLNGHRVEVVTADDGGDPGRNLALTRDMVENQGVVGFVGNIVPLSLTGSISYLEQQGIPLIGGDLTDQAWYSSPMVFPQGAKIDGALRGAARLAVEAGGPRVALLYCGEAAACFVARDLFQGGAVTDAGGELVYSAQVSLAQPDFTAECIQMRSRNVDAVVATVDGNSLSRVARACAQQDVEVQYVSFSLALVSSLADDPNLQGLVGTSALFPWMLTDGPASEYAQAIATYAPTLNTSGATAGVWGSGKLVEAASRNLPPGDVTSADLVAGLLALDGETLGGLTPPLRFRAGQPPPEVSCYVTIALTGGAFAAMRGLEFQGC